MRNFKESFSIMLAKSRVMPAMVNSVLIFAALGLNSSKMDYVIAGSYLVLNLACWLAPLLKQYTLGPLRYFFLGVDLVFTGFMIAETGGTYSELYPFLFIPVYLAVLRCGFFGIINWCSLMSMIMIAASIYSKTLDFMPLSFEIVYLYLAGISGNLLIQRTYSLNEAVSKKLARWNIDLQQLNSFSLEINSSSNLDEIFTRILQIVKRNNQFQMAAIMMFSGESLVIYDQIGWEENWVQSYNLQPLSKHSLALVPIIVHKQPFFCTDITMHQELYEIFRGIPVVSLSAFPLVISGEVTGALVITNQDPRALKEPEIQILTGIANQAGIAIRNAVYLRQEKRKADTDGLTGLYNRRYFNEQLELLSAKAEETMLPLSLILIDADNFKKYNDTYGHPAGDHLLKTKAAAIGEAVREQDITARYGGEEFAVILQDTDNRSASLIAERIRRAVADIPLEVLKLRVTISIGVGTFPDNAGVRTSLLEFADKSLYYAKANGKNRVCCGNK